MRYMSRVCVWGAPWQVSVTSNWLTAAVPTIASHPGMHFSRPSPAAQACVSHAKNETAAIIPRSVILILRLLTTTYRTTQHAGHTDTLCSLSKIMLPVGASPQPRNHGPYSKIVECVLGCPSEGQSIERRRGNGCSSILVVASIHRPGSL